MKRSWSLPTAVLLACAAGGVAEARRQPPPKTGDAVVEGVVREVFRNSRGDQADYLVQIEARRSELGRGPAGARRVEAPAPGRQVYVHVPQAAAGARPATPAEGSSVRAYVNLRDQGGWEAASSDWFEPSREAFDAAGGNDRPAPAPAPAPADRPAAAPTSSDRGSVLAEMGLKTDRVDAGGRLIFKVAAVAAGSAAEKAGLEKGDTVIGANGHGFTSLDQADELLRKEGDVARLEVLDSRTGDQATIRIDVPNPVADQPRAEPRRSLGVKVQPRRVGFRVALEVADLAPGGAAQRAGIEKGDVLMEAAGERLTDEAQLQKIVDRSGSTLTVTVRDGRTGKDVPVEVVLGAAESPRPGGTPSPRPSAEPPPAAGGPLNSRSFGVTTEAATVGLLPVVRIVSVARGSAAERAGLKAGDAVTQVADRIVFAPDLFDEALGKAGSKFTLTLLDERTGEKSSVNVDLGR